MAESRGAARHSRQPSSRRIATPWQALSLLGGGLVLLLLFLSAVGSSRHWWNPVLGLRFLTRSAAGLQPGQQVKVAGIPVGRVRRLQIRPDAQVLVSLDVSDDHRRLLGRRSRASLSQDNLLSPSYVAITPDPEASGGVPLADDALLPFDAHPDLQALITSVAESRIQLQKTLDAGLRLTGRRIPASLDQLDQTLVASRRLAGSLQGDLGRTVSVVGSTALQWRQTAGTADRLLNRSDGMADRAVPLLLQTLDQLQGITTTLNGLVQRLDRSLLLQLLSPAPSPTPPAAAPSSGSRGGALPEAAATGRPQERNNRE